ncbi:MAG: saccharopine dehydrogenase NADP-binding domain-containing protein [Actinomycetota bacterium]|nr:saccharopine dehydrogenase NADP-binding domain-containing protein [Actinomycetota bacterium]
MPERTYDLVLFGATGFAGGLTAEYLAQHQPAGLRWALAGRNTSKLEAVRARLAAVDATLADLPLLSADVTDAASVRAVAQSTRVAVTTVGPYVLYGEPLVAACAEAGTDYVDLTGEPEFVNTTYVRYHARAVQTGARLIHSCGFDSIPHDIGAYFTVLQLPENVPLRVSGYVRSSGAVSGGTLHSVLTGFSRLRANRTAARERKALEPTAGDRRSRCVVGRPHRDPVGDTWALPLPTIDGDVVANSARAIARYGPDFQYSHYASVPGLPLAVGGVFGVGTLLGLAQIPLARKVILNRFKPGDGPSAAKRARSWFTVTFVGEGGAHRVVTRVSGGDPGYDETAKMLAESALALAFDELPAAAGQITTATAMGDALLARLQAAGMKFEVVSA